MTISLRLSDEDTCIIRSYAKLKNQTISEIMREAILEQIEREYDLRAYDVAFQEYRENPVTYSQNEIERELGLS
ncbi:hypothetical protein FACS1894198_0500 [Clostridia bacterium]|nr:hypothetical protein FACS1894198_0500 [Clostridia bacterium]